MAETVNLHSEIKEKNKEEYKQEYNQEYNQEYKSNENKLLNMGDDLLLPIVVILMLNKSDLNFPILDNIKKITKDIINLPLNIDLSSQDIQGMMNAISLAEPYMNSDNLSILDKLSTFFSGLYKITTIKELGNDMARNSSDNPNGGNNYNNQRQKALHMLGTLEQFMDENTKKNMQSFKSALNTLDRFQETSNALNEKKNNGGKIDIRDVIQLMSPIFSSGNFPDAQKIDSMIKMVQIMSALNSDDGDPFGGISNNKDEEEAFFELVIDRYDDE